MQPRSQSNVTYIPVSKTELMQKKKMETKIAMRAVNGDRDGVVQSVALPLHDAGLSVS